ncbi:hypothetical protein [Kitasatospora sp. NPDC054795]
MLPTVNGIKLPVTTISDTTRVLAVGNADDIWTAATRADSSWLSFYPVTSSAIQSTAAASAD